MHIQQLTLKHFRCFTDITFSFDAPLILLCGPNGSGKTSILEGIHYLCYLRSFRTYSPADMLAFGQPSFFVRAALTLLDNTINDVQVGVSGKKRLVKVNQRPIQSYKELMVHYRVVTITQDDIYLVNGEPAHRRLFLDQALMMQDPTAIALMQEYRHILEQRNALLSSSQPLSSYDSWTVSLWHSATHLQELRRAYITQLEAQINQLLSQFFNASWTISLEYSARYDHQGASSIEQVLNDSSLKSQELRFRRTLFGPHLDDVRIIFKDQNSRLYSSRGQQRLVAALLRIAHVQLVAARQGPAILLLDDIMTDFDDQILEQLISLIISMPGQRIFTAPYHQGHGINLLQKQNALIQNITG